MMFNPRHILAAAALMGAMASAPAQAQSQAQSQALPQAQTTPVVVELFTSQGCSSCPPADELIRKLATRDNVLPLALHVDYWDYLGWKDKFGDPAYTKRQKGYAHTGGRKMIYTPQMVVMGQEDVVGADAMALTDLIAEHAAKPPVVSVRAARMGTVLTVDLTPLAALDGTLDLHLMRFSPQETVEIRRGENAGKTLHYANVVHDWSQIGTWDSSAKAQFTVDLPDTMPVAVLVQRAGHGAVLAAAVAR